MIKFLRRIRKSIPYVRQTYSQKFCQWFHLQNHFLLNIKFKFKKLHLVFVCFFYFPSLLVAFVFYVSQLNFESYHRCVTGRPERIMLPGDVTNRKKAQDFSTFSARGRSRFCQHLCEIFHGSWKWFSPSLSVAFFLMQTFEDDKTSNASGAH